jgi:hypothetical protein
MQCSNKFSPAEDAGVIRGVKTVNKSQIFAIALASAMASFAYLPASTAVAEVTEESRKVTEIQMALKEFGYYKGRIDGKINEKLYAAMIKYSELIRSKGWSTAAGEITDVELKFLLKQYEKHVATKAADNSSANSKGRNSKKPTSQGDAASPSTGIVATAIQDGESSFSAGGGGTAGATDGSGVNSAIDLLRDRTR